MVYSVLKVHSTSTFEKSFLKLPHRIQDLAVEKDEWFRHDVSDPRLKTHKLKGELQGYWSYSINRQYRVPFRFFKRDEVIYYDIGTHEIYK